MMIMGTGNTAQGNLKNCRKRSPEVRLSIGVNQNDRMYSGAA